MKKSLLRLSMVVAMLVSAFAWSAQSFAAVGDVNGDNVVSGSDVTALYGHLLENKEVAGNADVNGDGIVSGADVTYLYGILLGEITPAEGKLYILGTVVEGGWAPNKGIEMTGNGNVYTATLPITGVQYFSFTTKLAENDGDNGGWDEIAESRIGAVSDGDFWVVSDYIGQTLSLQAGENPFRVRAEGDITLTVDLDAMTIVINGEVLPEPNPDESDKVYIMGDPAGGWKTNLGLEMQYDENAKVYTATISSDGDMYFGFTTKLADTEDAWDDIVAYRFGAVSEGGDFNVTNSNKGEIALASNADGGQTLLIQGGGEFKLTLDKANMKLKIEGEIKEVVAEAEYYYIGIANGWSTSNLDYPFEPQGNGVHKIVITNPAAAEWFAIAPKAAYGSSNFWGQVLRPSTGNGTGVGTVSYATGDSYGSWCVNNATSITITLDTTKGTVTVE